MDTNSLQEQQTSQHRGNEHAPVTVIGLGLMGQALAGAFLRAGHPTTVWNRTPAKAEQLVAQGARLADSVGDAVAAGPLIVVCVSDYDSVHELFDPLGDVLDGRTLVNLTSGTSEQAREMAAWAAQRGSTYLDGAIMATPPGIGSSDTIVLYSGPQSAFEQHEPVLRNLGPGITYLGADHGLSSLYDVALLGLMWGILNAFLQGAALVGTAGVDAATFASFAGQGVGTVAGWLPAYAQQIDDGTYPAFDSTIDTHLAAMDHLVHESESLGVHSELPKLVKALTERAVAEGHGGDSYAAMIELFRKPSGARP
ncbi:NAD(P)-dependent oxidoreductase [Streptomyces sp. CA-250714]|uniref:NAD(P)-dependent oxidoreductase n=1 Tax=Streptomyces sp. CA-250714 TaxID=3240060 RepID=UPI003D8B3C0E